MEKKPQTIRLVVDNGLSQEVKVFSEIVKKYRMTADDLSMADWQPESIAIFKKAMELEKLDPQRPEDVATMLKRMHDSHFGIGQKNDPGS